MSEFDFSKKMVFLDEDTGKRRGSWHVEQNVMKGLTG